MNKMGLIQLRHQVKQNRHKGLGISLINNLNKVKSLRRLRRRKSALPLAEIVQELEKLNNIQREIMMKEANYLVNKTKATKIVICKHPP